MVKKPTSRRAMKKWVKHVLHEARHARNMRSDIADAKDLAALQEAERALVEAWENKESIDIIDQRVDAVSESAHALYPPRSDRGIRENVEIIMVAVCIAMAFRTYFIQPFKIPTGSMEPTLHGIQVDAEAKPTFMDRVPMRWVKFVATGKRFVEVKARVSGKVLMANDLGNRRPVLLIGPNRTLHALQKGMKLYVNDGNYVAKGTLLASGMVTAGDHIFVNKVKYNFQKPERGDIVVFRTDEIVHPDIFTTDHYIKRLVGLPNEKVQVHPPHLVIDGEPITQPYPFWRLLNDSADGYNGYTLASRLKKSKLSHESDVIQLGPDQFLPFGDNTNFSLDGRYFGGVPLRSITGPAFAVYWPFPRFHLPK